MAITVTERGTVSTAEGGSHAMTGASAAFTAGAGVILVAAFGLSGKLDAGGPLDAVFSVSDTIADTGGGTWTQRATCTRGTVATNSYAERIELWTRVVGTTPGASKTITGSISLNGSTTSSDNFCSFHYYEVAGQNATPIGLTASPSPATTGTTFAPDLGGVPATDSAVFGMAASDDNSSSPGPITPPTGWTESDEFDSAAFGMNFEWAYKNGSSVQAPSWSGFTNGNRLLGCAVEIKAAAATFIAPPSPVILQAVTTSRYW